MLSIGQRSIEIQNYINHLRTVLPYPMQWYMKLSDKQITSIHKKHSGILVQRAAESCLSVVSDQPLQMSMELCSEKSKELGEYALVTLNRRSLRFTYTTVDGKEIGGIISKLHLRHYANEGSDTLDRHQLSLAWETGKVQILDVHTLVDKIMRTAGNNPQKLVQAIYAVVNSKKESKLA